MNNKHTRFSNYHDFLARTVATETEAGARTTSRGDPAVALRDQLKEL